MCNGGEGRTLKPCCDAALASSKAYISNGPAKAHSLPTLPPPPSALPPLNPSLPGPPRLALAPVSLLLLLLHHPSLPLPPSLPLRSPLARSLTRARASVDDSCPRSPPPSTFLGPESPCGGDAWAGGGIREALYKSPGYRLTRAHSFSPLLAPSPLPLCHSSSGLILRRFFFFAFCPPPSSFLLHIPRLCPSQSRSQLLLYLFHLYESFFFFFFFSFSPSLNFWHRS